MKPRHLNLFTQLTLSELSPHSIWVDAESAHVFWPATGFPLDEDDVVEIPASRYKESLEELTDIGRFYALCEVRFADGSMWPGLAYVRAEDLCVYHVEVFAAQTRVGLPLQSFGTSPDEMREIETQIQKSTSETYPLTIHVLVDALHIHPVTYACPVNY